MRYRAANVVSNRLPLHAKPEASADGGHSPIDRPKEPFDFVHRRFPAPTLPRSFFSFHLRLFLLGIGLDLMPIAFGLLI